MKTLYTIHIIQKKNIMIQIARMHNSQSLWQRRVTLSGRTSCNVEQDNFLVMEIWHLQNLSETIKCYTISKYYPSHDTHFYRLCIYLSKHELKWIFYGCFPWLPWVGHQHHQTICCRSLISRLEKAKNCNRSIENVGCFTATLPNCRNIALVTTEE